jgi:hypothetical protein
MLPDLFIPVNTWVELYAATGIAPGVSLKVTNKSDYHTVTWEGDSSPPTTPDNRHGEPVAMGESVRNTVLTTSYWVMSWSTNTAPGQQGRISVQEWTP